MTFDALSSLSKQKVSIGIAVVLFFAFVFSSRPANASDSSSVQINPASFGSTGENVVHIQTILIQQGFLSVAATGTFGPLTEAAVKAFQSANGIETTGTVGPKTSAALMSSSGTSAGKGISSLASSETQNGASAVGASPVGTASTASCTDKTTPSVAVLSPNGQESYGLSGKIHITWSSCAQPSVGVVSISLVKQSSLASIPAIFAKPVLMNAGQYDFPIPSDIVAGRYFVAVACHMPGSDSDCIDPAHSEDQSIASFLIIQSGGLWVTQNPAYSDQMFAPSSTDVKIGSFIVHNTSPESLSLSSLYVGLSPIASQNSMSVISNLEAYIDGTLAGTPAVIPFMNNSFLADTSLSSGSTAEVDIYANTGTLAPSGIHTIALLGAKGATSGLSYSSAPQAMGQNITVAVAPGTLAVTMNPDYGNQTVSPNTPHEKIGSFTIANTTTESISINDIKLNDAVGNLGTNNLSNLTVSANGAMVLAPSDPSIYANGKDIPVTGTVIAPNMSVTVDVYADIGAATTGTDQVSLSLVKGIGAYSDQSYSATSVVLGQKITPSIGPVCTINSFTAFPVSVVKGTSSVLSWNTENCASLFISGGGISSSFPLSGSTSPQLLSSTATYTMTASGFKGDSAKASLTISVK